MFPLVLDPKFPLLALFDPELFPNPFPNVLDPEPPFAPLLLPVVLVVPPPLDGPNPLLDDEVFEPAFPPVLEVELELPL